MTHRTRAMHCPFRRPVCTSSRCVACAHSRLSVSPAASLPEVQPLSSVWLSRSFWEATHLSQRVERGSVEWYAVCKPLSEQRERIDSIRIGRSQLARFFGSVGFSLRAGCRLKPTLPGISHLNCVTPNGLRARSAAFCGWSADRLDTMCDGCKLGGEI